MEKTNDPVKKKIIYLITKATWGGAQKQVFELSIWANKNNYEVIVAGGKVGKLKEELEKNSIRFIEIPDMGRDIAMYRDWKSFKKIYNLIKEEKPDIIHTHSPKAGGIGALATRFANKKTKIIYTAHGFAWHENRKILEKIFIIIFSWLTIMLSHKTIIITKEEFEEVKLLPFISSKTRYIANGINKIHFLNQNKALVSLSLRLKKHLGDKILIQTSAELHKNKGLLNALEAISILKDKYKNILYIIFGEGEERKKIEKYIENKGLENNVHLAGYTENNVEILKAFDLCLIPSEKEGLPYALLEAGQAGLPIIATSIGGIPDVIEDMKSGILIQKNKPGELVSAVDFILSHKSIAKSYGKNIEEKVLRDFSIEKMISEISSIYKTN